MFRPNIVMAEPQRLFSAQTDDILHPVRKIAFHPGPLIVSSWKEFPAPAPLSLRITTLPAIPEFLGVGMVLPMFF
jgi:hypothetical protein